ncbi:MAG: hypothetical protein FH756_09555 [Firmicutes bacterium]|nr:hypothetical protein [Bacillota bacterium]
MFKDVLHTTIFCGNLGSGKTEVAINFSLSLKKYAKNVCLADIDVVNPYFRTRMIRHYLTEKGINVVCPIGELAGADVPALPPSILGVLQNPEVKGVFDVGGDDIGATALGRFKPYLKEGSYNLYFVVNTRRPFTKDTDGILKYVSSIEKASRLKVTALVNNSNLGLETDIETVISGHEVVRLAAGKLGLPVGFAASLRHLVTDLEKALSVPVLPLDLNMQPPWSQAAGKQAKERLSIPGERFFK